MVWARVDDQYPDHPKVTGLSDAAFRLHISAITYASRYLTDGFLPFGQVRKLLPFTDDVQPVCDELVEAALFTVVPKGYTVHDYLEYNPSREEVEAKREQGALRTQWDAMRRYVARRVYGRDGHRCRICGSTVNLTVDHIIPLARGGTNDLDNLQTLCRSCNSRKGVR